MLSEPVNYHRNLNFAIDFSNVAEEAPHYHKETEMALVLKGTATYRIHHQEFKLKTGDAIIVDTYDLHRITESSEDVIMLTFYINMEAFTHLYPNIDFMIFACEEFSQDASERHQKMQNKISFLIHHMAQMMFLRMDENTADQLMSDKLQEILYLMVNHFQGFFIENKEFRYGNDDANPVDLDRLYRIITYMYQNYDKKITLQDVADMEHLSMYYASHLIKKLSGLSFQNLLNYIRVEVSEKSLNEDKYTLTQISDHCGFSSLAYYNKCFKIWHGITPAQYRKQPRPSSRSFHKPFDRNEAMMLLEPYLNTELPAQHEEDNRFSSHHIFIPVQPTYSDGINSDQIIPLNIILDSPDQLSEYKDILVPLKPHSITCLSDTGGSVRSGENSNANNTHISHYRSSGSYKSVRTAADALEYLINERSPHMRIINTPLTSSAYSTEGTLPDLPSLLNASGMPTPFYSLFKALAQIPGKICEKQKQYILVKSNDSISLIIFNTDMYQPLNVYLQFNHNNRPACMVRKSIKKTHCIRYISNILNDSVSAASDTAAPVPGTALSSYIPDLVSGTTELLKVSEPNSQRINLTMEPGELTILIF